MKHLAKSRNISKIIKACKCFIAQKVLEILNVIFENLRKSLEAFGKSDRCLKSHKSHKILIGIACTFNNNLKGSNIPDESKERPVFQRLVFLEYIINDI